MKTMIKKTNRVKLENTELQNMGGGFLIPFLITRAVVKGLELINKAIDWLTTEH